MPLFNYIPDVKYDVKPVQYPFTQSDFITAKNFFRRFKLNPDVFDYALYYDKYAVLDVLIMLLKNSTAKHLTIGF